MVAQYKYHIESFCLSDITYQVWFIIKKYIEEEGAGIEKKKPDSINTCQKYLKNKTWSQTRAVSWTSMQYRYCEQKSIEMEAIS